MNSSISDFSYIEYEKILNRHRPNLKDFFEARVSNQFTILRHDVEFSIKRALKIAQLESSNNVKSTFFIQVRSNSYNLGSLENQNRVLQITKLGHNLGLHFYISHLEEGNWTLLENELKHQKNLFEEITNEPCKIFSYHRPPKWVLLNREDEIEGILNAYGDSFFEFSPKPKRIKYIADSRHQWSYGSPMEKILQKKIQILLHPDEWSEAGYSEYHNFQSLIDENKKEFMGTMDSETKRYREFASKLL